MKQVLIIIRSWPCRLSGYDVVVLLPQVYEVRVAILEVSAEKASFKEYQVGVEMVAMELSPS